MRIALANVPISHDPTDALSITLQAMAQAAQQQAAIICFPESFLPGYRLGRPVIMDDPSFLQHAWTAVDQAAKQLQIAVILGTERPDGDRLLITARVTNSDGSCAGFQDKIQLDPTEEPVYDHGSERHIFRCGELTFGIVICHEGWRYPETVRWAVRHGAQVVFHPHTEVVENPAYLPSGFADPRNSFHEKALLCRAAENTCFIASVNNAIPGASTTSAFIAPDGTLLTHQPYGQAGLLIADLDLSLATGLLAHRLRPQSQTSPP